MLQCKTGETCSLSHSFSWAKTVWDFLLQTVGNTADEEDLIIEQNLQCRIYIFFYICIYKCSFQTTMYCMCNKSQQRSSSETRRKTQSPCANCSKYFCLSVSLVFSVEEKSAASPGETIEAHSIEYYSKQQEIILKASNIIVTNKAVLKTWIFNNMVRNKSFLSGSRPTGPWPCNRANTTQGLKPCY